MTLHRRLNAGTYEFVVELESFGNSEPLPLSMKVEVLAADGFTRTFTPPENQVGNSWHVFSLDSLTGELTEVNKVLDNFEPYTGGRRCQPPSKLPE